MYLVQLLLPVRDKNAKLFPAMYYVQVRQELTERFSGLTAYTRAPAEGLWKKGEQTVEKDDIVIFEVMLDQLDEAWWHAYKIFLQQLFNQDELIIRAQEMRLL